jgi:hypothetical protein
LAWYHANDLRTFASTNRDEQLRIAEKAITEALVLAPGNALAHFVHANVLHVSGATERSLRESELAITLDHNLAWAHADAGFMKLLLGRGEEAEADLTNAIRLSPRDPGMDRWISLLGDCRLISRSARVSTDPPAQVGRNESKRSAYTVLPGRSIGVQRPYCGGEGGSERWSPARY